MTDLFVLLASPGGGDDLQGIKRGVMEFADLVLVTKADGDLLPASRRAVADYHAALHLMQPKHKGLRPAVLGVSALEGQGVAEAWETICAIHKRLAESGLTNLREAQRERWFQNEIQEAFVEAFRADSGVARHVRELETDVRKGLVLPTLAARQLIRIYWTLQP
jgi:LAO/AO transport system kinase